MFKGQPKGLYALALANTGERFGYYTMLAIFLLFLQAKFGFTAAAAGQFYAIFLAAVYFMPVLGGWLADKIGFGKCVVTGVSVMFLGYLLLAIPTDAFQGRGLALTMMIGALLLIAVGVKLSSPGPVFFAQERIGKDKKPFTMYKFRSLVVNDDSDTAWSGKSDSRRTAFGGWLRRCSLDELPQLFNVLRGDMSLVGPRPEIPYYVHRFKEEVPLYMVRHQVRPGMTGWAQIHGYRGDTPIPERVKHDVWYIENWSLWLDLRIMLDTVFRGKFMNNEAPGAK